MKSKKIDCRSLAIDELLQVFRNSVVAYWDVMTRRSSQSERDSAYKEVMALSHEFRRRSEDERLKLVPFLEDPNPGVRLFASHELYELIPDVVLTVYEGLTEQKGLANIYAQSALDRIRGVDRYADSSPPLTP